MRNAGGLAALLPDVFQTALGTLKPMALLVRQILQGALVICRGNLRRFPANFCYRRLRLASPLLPLGGMHEIFGGRRAWNPVGGGSELWPPLTRLGRKRAWLCAA